MGYHNQSPTGASKSPANGIFPSVGNRRCPACTGPLNYDSRSQKLKCEYCDGEYELSPPTAATENAQAARAQTAACSPSLSSPASAPEGLNLDNQPQPAEQPTLTTSTIRKRRGERPLQDADSANTDWGTAKKIAVCNSCGAQTIYDAVTISNVCPYCDSPQIIEETDADGHMAPTGVCVFKIDKQQADQQFRSWVKKLWFAPNKLKKAAKTDALVGVYLPYWVYDTQVYADYKGKYGVEIGEDAYIWKDSDGSVEHYFEDYLIPACKKENSHIIEQLAPFETKDYKDYRPEYMAGYAAERYAFDVHTGWQEAQKRMKKDLEEMAKDDIKKQHKMADEARIVELNTAFHEITYKYLMLPIWISSYRFNGKVYQFMVNGQNGKVAGDRPYSAWKIALAILLAAIICIIGSRYIEE